MLKLNYNSKIESMDDIYEENIFYDSNYNKPYGISGLFNICYVHSGF